MAGSKRIGILTSGGDAPGMNAAIRAAALVGRAGGADIVGIERGYKGLLEDAFVPLMPNDVSGILREGGTILGSARCKEFHHRETRDRARAVLANRGVDGLIVIGGNGSLTGAMHLCDAKELGAQPLNVIGIPASIDNDLGFTGMCIGVDTAMNTIVEACDRIFDTATAHKRTFIVEVMGRDCGYLAMTAGIAAGADAVLVRETDKTEAEIVEQVVSAIQRAYAPTADGRDAKRRVLVMKAEGVNVDSARLKEAVDARIAELLPDVDSRVTVLGHVVRGGSPTAFDRLLAARLANVALRAVAAGQSDFMAGWSGPGIARPPCPWDPYVVLTPLEEVLSETAKLMSGESELAKWRKRIFQEVENILQR